MMIFFAMGLICSVLCSRQALAHDAPTIAPTRLEFDATQAPKNCNDEILFRNLLTNWVPYSALSGDAERRVSVHIQRRPTGNKEWSVILSDAAGATVKEWHERYDAKTECYKVLYEAAHTTAKLLGAFQKPAPPEPCPICPPPPASPGPAFCPEPPAPALQRRSTTASVPLRQTALPPLTARRAYFGAGVLFGTGITPQGAIGPYATLGFVPSRNSPRFQVEFAGAWTSQNGLDANVAMDVIPMFGSVCYSREVLRICSGITTTFFWAKQKAHDSRADELRVTLAGHVRVGTEFEVTGPLSIRIDAFAQMRFAGQTFGQGSSTLDTQPLVDLGATAMGVWSLE